MNEVPKRRPLMSVTSNPTPLPDGAIAAVAEANGFPTTHSERAPAAPRQEPAPAEPTVTRRQRTPTGRNHQFNVKLRQDTLDFIYGEANSRNIPIAQVIEESMEALKRQRGS